MDLPPPPPGVKFDNALPPPPPGVVFDSPSPAKQTIPASIPSNYQPGMAGDILLQGGADLGKWANDKIQAGAGNLAEASGRAMPNVPPMLNPGVLAAGTLGTASEFAIPTTKAGVALTALGGGLKALGPASKALGPLAETRVIKPGPMAKTLGAMSSSLNAVPVRYAQAVMADPSILSDATPGIAEVGKEYTAAFKKAGQAIDSKTYQEITGSRFPPSEKQAGKLKDIVENALNKLEAAQAGAKAKLTEAEAFVARSAASALERTSEALTNPRFKQVASGAKNAFDDFLENSSLPNIRDLSRKYFRAVAKEHYESLIPQNKNMSPNVLRALIMGKNAAGAVGDTFTGNFAGAAGKAAETAAMSPVAMAHMLRGVSNNFGRPPAPALQQASPIALSAALNQRRQDVPAP